MFNDDYNHKCAVDEHALFQIMAGVFMVVYVIGVPAAVLHILLQNREHLHMDTRQTVVYPAGGSVVGMVGGVRSRVSSWVSFMKNVKQTNANALVEEQQDRSKDATKGRRSSLVRNRSAPTNPTVEVIEQQKKKRADDDADADIHIDSRHHAVKYQFGALYSQYEKDYFWFELVILLMKMTMTGAMVIIEPGSPLQLLYATIVMTIYMLVVLKSAPYNTKNEDWVSFMVVAVLVLDNLAGFALIMDRGREPSVFDSDAMGIGLIVLNVTCIVVQVAVVIVIRWNLQKKCTRKNCRKRCQRSKANNSNKKKKKLKQVEPAQQKKKKKKDGNDHHIANNETSIEIKSEDPNDEANDKHPTGETAAAKDKQNVRNEEATSELKKKESFKKLEVAHEQQAERKILLTNHRRKLRKQTTLKVQQRRQAQILLKHTRELRNTEIFKDYDPELLKTIIDNMDLKIFLSGENIVTENELGDSFMVVVRGTADVFKEGHGKINTLDTSEKRRMIGEAALVDKYHVRSATVVATGDYTQVLELTRAKYEELIIGDLTNLKVKTDEKVRRLSVKLQAADVARKLPKPLKPPQHLIQRQRSLAAPPTSQSRESSFNSWDDGGEGGSGSSGGDNAVKKRMSLIARPTARPTAQQKGLTTVAIIDQRRATITKKKQLIKKKTPLKTQQRRRAQMILKHTQALRKTEIFKDYSEDQLQTIITSMQLRTFDDGQNIVRENEAGSELMIIMKGTADVYKQGFAEKIKTLDTTTSRMIGEAALLQENYTRSATVRAVGDDVQVLVLTRSAYKALQSSATIEEDFSRRARKISMSLQAADAARSAGKTSNEKEWDHSQSVSFS